MILALVLLGGSGGALFYAMRARARAHVIAPHEDAGTSYGDAPLLAEVEDAGIEADAERAPVPTRLDAGIRSSHEHGIPLIPPPHAKTITVEVLTRPAEANVFDHRTFRGPSGAKLSEPYGTKLELECRAPHYKGRITVVFDGSRDSVMCTAKRLPFCVEGLKNVFDDCEPKAAELPETP